MKLLISADERHIDGQPSHCRRSFSPPFRHEAEEGGILALQRQTSHLRVRQGTAPSLSLRTRPRSTPGTDQIERFKNKNMFTSDRLLIVLL